MGANSNHKDLIGEGKAQIIKIENRGSITRGEKHEVFLRLR